MEGTVPVDVPESSVGAGLRRTAGTHEFVCHAMAVVVALSSRLLMDVYFDELRIPEISDTAFYRCLFAFTFYPVLLCFKFAQTAPLMLLGLAGFLWFATRNRPVI